RPKTIRYARARPAEAPLDSTVLVPASAASLDGPGGWLRHQEARSRAVRGRVVWSQQVAKNRAVRLPWQAGENARTCARCGYPGRVPGAVLQKPISGFNSAPRGRPVSLGGI